MEWRLIFSGTQSPLWAVSVFIAVAAAITMFLMLRRYEARLIPGHISAVLLTLRVLVLVLLLATMLQPVLTRESTTEEQGRLLVGIDASESMDTADRHASPAEMLMWAQALGMLGNAESNEQIEEWISAYQEGRVPDFGQGDVSIQPLIDGVFDEFRTMPRTEFVRRLLKSQPNNLIDSLAAQHNLEIQVFGLESQPIQSSELDRLSDSTKSAVQPGGTNIAEILRTATGNQQNAPLNSIVLFTDGRHTSAQDAAAEAERMGSLGVAVHCVPIGSRLSPRDLAVASVDVPQTVFLNDDARVEATISAVGYSGDQIDVTLLKDGDPIDQRTVTVAGNFFTTEFDIPADEVGSFDYSIQLPSQAGELRDDNNQRDFSVSVVDNKTKVWLIDGRARWEFRYLNSALERDPQVALTATLFEQPTLKLLNRTYLDKELPVTSAEQKERLAETDILILGDIDPQELPDAFWTLVDEAVTNEGLTVCFVPGKRFMPHAFQSEKMQALLPVVSPRQQLAERYRRTLPDSQPSVFRIEPTALGREQPLLQLDDPDAVDSDLLQRLPGHPWAYTGQAKPAASVWATLAMAGEDLGELPVVVHQFYGFGQVVWLGIDSTWRWRFRAGDKWHHRFWGQVVRWAARNKSAAGNDQVRLTLSDVIASESENIDVSVRWDPRLVSQLKDAKVEVVTELIESDVPDSATETPDAVETRLQLQPVENAPERFRGSLSSLPPGRYRVRLAAANTSITLTDDVFSELQVTKRVSTELANVSCHREFLQQIADAAGGRLMEPWQLSELPDLLSVQPESSDEIQERTLWDHWGTMLMFFVLLSAEWITRKMHGLP